MSIEELSHFISNLKLNKEKEEISSVIVKEISERLNFFFYYVLIY